LPRPEPPAHSSFGSTALHRHRLAEFAARTEDIVEHPWNDDPRVSATTPAEGYVDPITLAERDKEVNLIDHHYSSILSPDFYTKFGFKQDEPMSKIVKRTQTQDQNGEFLTPSSTYIELLADLQTVHTAEATKFASERLPAYVDDYTRRLQTYGLGYLVDPFTTKLQTTKVIYDDGFDTLIRGGGGRHERHYQDHTIVIAPSMDWEDETVVHEFNHLWEGDLGLTEAFQDEPNLLLALYEGEASHIEHFLLFKGGDIQDIRSRIAEDGMSYPLFRNILDVVCNGGEQTNSIHEVIAAIGAEKPEAPRAFRQAIQKSMADHPDFITKLEDKLSRLHPGENTTDPIVEQEITDYLEEIRVYYQTKKQNTSRGGKLVRLLRGLRS
jgi:hypothetical protein